MDIRDLCAVVTGGAKGIGAAIALWNAWTVLRSKRSLWAKLWGLVLAASCVALLFIGIACHVVGFSANY